MRACMYTMHCRGCRGGYMIYAQASFAVLILDTRQIAAVHTQACITPVSHSTLVPLLVSDLSCIVQYLLRPPPGDSASPAAARSESARLRLTLATVQFAAAVFAPSAASFDGLRCHQSPLEYSPAVDSGLLAVCPAYPVVAGVFASGSASGSASAAGVVCSDTPAAACDRPLGCRFPDFLSKTAGTR